MHELSETPTPSASGRNLLDRRRFLERAGTGLSGIALASLLGADGLLAQDGVSRPPPWRPDYSPGAPLAARKPPFRTRACRVLMIFCSGAMSHLDTFDYKPELIRRHGQPIPGGDKLVTFQGAQGNLTRSPYRFRPRGECGKYTSDLLPRLGAEVDRMCFVHSMTARSNTTAPARTRRARAAPRTDSRPSGPG